jgi:hypothetical protein
MYRKILLGLLVSTAAVHSVEESEAQLFANQFKAKQITANQIVEKTYDKKDIKFLQDVFKYLTPYELSDFKNKHNKADITNTDKDMRDDVNTLIQYGKFGIVGTDLKFPSLKGVQPVVKNEPGKLNSLFPALKKTHDQVADSSVPVQEEEAKKEEESKSNQASAHVDLQNQMSQMSVQDSLPKLQNLPHHKSCNLKMSKRIKK